MPHGVCYVWDPSLIWLHAISDGLIALAYFSIPAIIFLLLRQRPDFPFRRILAWFAAFVFACGLTHVLEVLTIWSPVYWLSGTIKAVTALISIGVAFTLWRLRPVFLQAPSPETYRRLNEELDSLVKERTASLEASNARLRDEIAHRRHAEDKAAALNRTLANRVSEQHTLLDLLPVGIAFKTRDQGVQLMHNQAFSDLFELSLPAIGEPGLPPRELFAPVRSFVEDQELSYEELPLVRSSREGCVITDVEQRIILPSGTKRTLLVSARPLTDDEGNLRGSVATFQDITRRQQAESDLRLVIEASPNAMILADHQGRIQLANTEAHRLFGYEPGTLHDACVDDLVPDGHRQSHQHHRQHFAAHPSKRAMGAGDDLFGCRRDGTRIPLEIGLNPIHLSSGPAVLASIIDLTDRNRSEEERLQFERSLHETQKLESLGILAGGIAHDFNNILTGILGHSSLIRHDNPPPEGDLLEAIDQIELSAERAADLCRQLMAYAGKGKFEQKAINLSHLVTETGKLLEVSVGKVARIRYRLTRNLPSVMGDPTQLRQVLMNLVINASEAVEPKLGIITVSTQVIDAHASYLRALDLTNNLKPGRYITLEVQDDGKGMDAETRGRIFDPFFTTKFTGRGLGLAAVQGIVHNHGGGIRVYSEPDRGTLFKILLPADDASTAELAPAPAAVPAKPRLSGHVLVVDDEPAVRRLAGRALQRFGFAVELVDSGPAALAWFDAHPGTTTLAMVDLTMPDMDGDEVIQELHRRQPELPILLMSGFNEQDIAERFGSRRPDAFLSKPFTIESLLSMVRQCLHLDVDPSADPGSESEK
ncbi:PAS domain-containing hybrid sensor histidine kinase/response regulator [Actomonas aquatica]|uniref:histidine kinase n=1 Tax=Actomonas aquatica TaxID=2866162 RepID=A0ABZ1C4W7_9BACT|nr:PAS domain S-box protein [Opitutus sp. WL0086]WRQ86373.1 PAS domain S-box protein [Opitutus sp. WL0086]